MVNRTWLAVLCKGLYLSFELFGQAKVSTSSASDSITGKDSLEAARQSASFMRYWLQGWWETYYPGPVSLPRLVSVVTDRRPSRLHALSSWLPCILGKACSFHRVHARLPRALNLLSSAQDIEGKLKPPNRLHPRT